MRKQWIRHMPTLMLVSAFMWFWLRPGPVVPSPWMLW